MNCSPHLRSLHNLILWIPCRNGRIIEPKKRAVTPPPQAPSPAVSPISGAGDAPVERSPSAFDETPMPTPMPTPIPPDVLYPGQSRVSPAWNPYASTPGRTPMNDTNGQSLHATLISPIRLLTFANKNPLVLGAPGFSTPLIPMPSTR